MHLPHPHTSIYSSPAKNTDISRLLDPSYASSSLSSDTSLRYIKDEDGDLHDPDYRLFPILDPCRASSSRPRIQRDRQRQRRVPSPADPFFSFHDATRPSWELGDDCALTDDEEEYYSESEQSHSYTSRDSGCTVRRSSSSSRCHRHSPPPFYPTDSAASYNYTYTSSSPSSSYPLTSTSFDSECTFVGDDASSSFDEKEKVLRKPKKASGFSYSSSRKSLEKEQPRSSFDSTASPLSYDEADSDVAAEDGSLEDDSELEHHATSPTRSEALKKEWHAVSLRVRIGVFRMKRRVRGALSP